MRYVGAIIVTLIAGSLVFVLDRPLGSLPALGRLLDPVNGWATSAENANKDFNQDISLEGIKQPVNVWFEERMVPHIQAQNDHDLYYTLGYIHATFRLWQMDMQTRSAAGRLGEVVGEKMMVDAKTGKPKNIILELDRAQRRKGMVYGAENKLKMMEANPKTKTMLDAYTAGINDYIKSLHYKDLPLEYKLMSFEPEPWTNLKCALMMMNMADDLTGYTEDFQLSALREQLSEDDFNYLYPLRTSGSIPVIPSGTKFETPSMQVPDVPEGELFTKFQIPNSNLQSQKSKVKSQKNSQHNDHNMDTRTVTLSTRGEGRGEVNSKFRTQNSNNLDTRAVTLSTRGEGRGEVFNISPSPLQGEGRGEVDGIGSNNWAISGNKTQSGSAILCNDPHLGLNLPSLWFEAQLTAPGINVYGVSLPGAPGIIIGFNDSISWGLTNNYRDVKDFYEIEKIDNNSYRFDGKQMPFDKKIEIIKIKGKPDYIDKVNYTLHGPVTYDETFADPLQSGKTIATTWMAHRSSNELLSIYLLNKAKNYQEFSEALTHFQCPAQNFVYADRQNNIAMHGQGQYINKWKDQGRYVMRGNTSATLWGKDIPMTENPHVLNPPQEYLASANQMTTDSTYPYWYNGYFSDFREWEINIFISKMYKNEDIHIQDIKYGVFEPCHPIESYYFKYLMSGLQNSSWSILNYNLLAKGITMENDEGILSYNSTSATSSQILWSFLYKNIWQDEFPKILQPLFPKEERTMQILLTDSSSKFFDDKRTPQIETLKDIIQRSFQQTKDSLDKLKKRLGTLEWYKVKGTQLTHLAKIDAFSYKDLKIGGWGNTINAVKKTHGPSWRMIVEMGKDSIKAYGVYPGGQSGNPGSKFYGTFVDSWVEGRYYGLLFIAANTKNKPKEIKYVWTIKSP